MVWHRWKPTSPTDKNKQAMFPSDINYFTFSPRLKSLDLPPQRTPIWFRQFANLKQGFPRGSRVKLRQFTVFS
ncbi:unnamed protein product [Tuber melanosporum]|uniref:(Perigord truffle) hypothetical protein n=1 Tax=Tuber melanosporum (strain Mel28) TaxID=656061 RepID=D5G8H3_TUBMM|nr:uncharacterized protein GSTUM_00002869001 [Tuber melanosporum]CAZ80816.1 unnamed protein product [Tuber melanosporum]